MQERRKMAWGYIRSGLFIHILIILCTFEDGGRVVARDNLLLGYPEDTHGQLRVDDGLEAMKSVHQHIINNGAIQDGSSHEKRHDHVQMSHMGHMDPSLNVFLTEKDLKVGNMMPVHFPQRDSSTSPHFLPREKADSIPFSSDSLPRLLQMFSLSEGSPQARAMDDTLRECERRPIEGENKVCATSLESMLDFVRAIFGVGSRFKVVTTKHYRKLRPTQQTHSLLHNYTILNIVREASGTKMVACHTMPYPFAVFYCHHQENKSKVFKVSLIGEYSEKVEAVVVCHMDTSAWDPDHVSFRMLSIKPGTDPVCHFFPQDHLVWVP